MRYQEAHAARSGSVPFTLYGKKTLQRVLSTAVAGVIGLAPAVLISSPALAANAVADDVTFTTTPVVVTEGGVAALELTWVGTTTGATPEADLTWKTETSGTATAGSDYTAVSSTLITFDGNKKATLSVTTLLDSLDEASPETINVSVYDPSGSTSVPIKTAVINITDDDPEPSYTFTANRTSVPEDGGTVRVTARLLTASGRTINIPYSTEDGTAKAGQDYVATSGTLTFAPTETEKYFDVTITDDALYEGTTPQTFVVKAGSADGVAATATPITISIVDNETTPKVGVVAASPTAVAEGQSLSYPLTLIPGSETAVTVKYGTTDTPTPLPSHGPATSGLDYTAVTPPQTVTFSPGVTAGPTAQVITKNDILDELPEDVTVALSEPSGAVIDPTKASAIGTITDQVVSLPVVSLTDASKTIAVEGNSGTKKHTVTVQLSQASGQEQKFTWAAANSGSVSAESGKDFVAGSGALTFAPGDTTKTFDVEIIGDLIDEGDSESFTITLARTAGTATGAGANTIVITDDDAKPTISLEQTDLKMPEGNGYSAALLQVNLSNPSAQGVSWTTALATDPGTATDGATLTGGQTVGADDYDIISVVSPTAQTIAAGQTSGYVLGLVKGDTVFEGDETIRLTAALNTGETDATGGPLSGTITLTNDDLAPALVVDSANAVEGDALALTGTTLGWSQSATLLNVTLAGEKHGTTAAASNNDFSPNVFSVNIPAGTDTDKKVPIGTVNIVNDPTEEPAEAIKVSGSGFGGTGTVKDGWIVIAASDGASEPTDPEEPGEEEPGKPTIATGSTTLTGTGTVTVTGKVAKGADVEFYGRPFGTEEWLKIKTAKADAEGHYSFARWIGTGYQFRTMSSELWSDILTVRVKQNPVLTVTSPSKGKLWVGVAANPKDAGQAVLVQSWVSGAWKTVYKGTTNASGAYSITSSIASGKSLTLRAFVEGDTSEGLLGNWTTSKKITIK